MQLCLAWGRAAALDVVMFADTDDFAPRESDLHLVLARVNDASLAGVKLFFDADGACPQFFCPRNVSDWERHCPGAATDMALNHWKPLVVPSRTADVTTHDFTALAPFERKQAWGRACLQHHNWQRPPAASSAPRLQLTRPKWLAKGERSTQKAPPQRCAEADEWCRLVRGR